LRSISAFGAFPTAVTRDNAAVEVKREIVDGKACENPVVNITGRVKVAGLRKI
jgi:hypothetical protein